MKHRIVVLGAGYAGAFVAGTLARRLSRADTEITDVFAGTGIQLRLARVTAVDAERRIVTVADVDGGGELGYDTLVYALGSHGDNSGLLGAAEHAFDIASRPSALRLRERLDKLDKRTGGGSVLVIGDGLTGIESATEIAESRPGLSVTPIARGELGARLSTSARKHLRRVCDRLEVAVLEHTSVETVEAERVLCTDGTVLASDATVWTAGFAVDPIAAEAGVDVTDDGRIAGGSLHRVAEALGQFAPRVPLGSRENAWT